MTKKKLPILEHLVDYALAAGNSVSVAHLGVGYAVRKSSDRTKILEAIRHQGTVRLTVWNAHGDTILCRDIFAVNAFALEAVIVETPECPWADKWEEAYEAAGKGAMS